MNEIKMKSCIAGVVLGATLSSYAGNDPIILAGWDGAVKHINSVEAYPIAKGIEATMVLSTTINDKDNQGDWTASSAGSSDETFGTFPGALPNMGMSAYLSRVDGVYIDYTIVNKSSVSYDLTGFHFDVYKKWGGSGFPSLRVMKGSDITEGSIMVGGISSFETNPAPDGEDYTDMDIDLSGLSDRTLNKGEQVTFRILMNNNGGTFIDNVAVTAVPSK